MLPGIKQFDLSGRVALVTGGSKGLGQAMAAGLASAGADLFLVSRNLAEAEAAALQIAEEFGVNATESSLMRSGTLARMIELSLVNREQSGRNVSYSLTEHGEKFKSA